MPPSVMNFPSGYRSCSAPSMYACACADENERLERLALVGSASVYMLCAQPGFVGCGAGVPLDPALPGSAGSMPAGAIGSPGSVKPWRVVLPPPQPAAARVTSVPAVKATSADVRCPGCAMAGRVNGTIPREFKPAVRLGLAFPARLFW